MSDRKRVAVLASGRGSNFEALARAAIADDYPARIIVLISDNPDAPALQIARDFEIEALHLPSGPKRTFLVPEIEQLWIDELVKRKVDLICLAGFMRLVKAGMLTAFSGRILNIHPSLLPSFPGLEAQRQALEHGVKVSGCTVHFVDESLDGGPIIIQRAVPVLDDDTAESLASRILAAEHEIYPQALKLWCEGRLRIEGRRVKNNNL